MGLMEDIAQLRAEQGEASGYLDARPKLREQLEMLQKNTVVHGEDLWAGQINDNWEHIVKRGSFAHLEGFGQDKTCIIVGASPALKKNVQCLKQIEGEFRNKFLLISVNSAAQFLLENGVIPDIVISVDCDEEVWTRDLSKINREDITLMCSPFVWPEVPRELEG